MKKLLFLTCFAVLFMSGCMLHNPKKPSVFVVTKITMTKNDNMALYTVKEKPHYSFKDKYFTFFDNKARFLVGDTVYFIQKYNY